jgi:hypothetical protein
VVEGARDRPGIRASVKGSDLINSIVRDARNGIWGKIEPGRLHVIFMVSASVQDTGGTACVGGVELGSSGWTLSSRFPTMSKI